jgi:hypothetical protein
MTLAKIAMITKPKLKALTFAGVFFVAQIKGW